jgi:hypothetical protein
LKSQKGISTMLTDKDLGLCGSKELGEGSRPGRSKQNPFRGYTAWMSRRRHRAVGGAIILY